MSEGRKDDSGKLRFGLIPPVALEEIARVLTYGANKYSDNNWRKVDASRYEDALGRHINAWRKGEECDQESGLKHLAHALTNMCFLLVKETEKEEVKPYVPEEFSTAKLHKSLLETCSRCGYFGSTDRKCLNCNSSFTKGGSDDS